MYKPRLFMLIGIPGSGKTTFINQLMFECPEEWTHIASTDQIIEEWAAEEGKTYDDVFFDYYKTAEKTMYEWTMNAIKMDKTIIWDQTNMNVQTRAKKLILIPDNYEKIAITFNVPGNLTERLASRPGKTIPLQVCQNMINSYEPPTQAEGFDRIISAEEYTWKSLYG